MIDQKTIERIAKLARLKISVEEAVEFGMQLDKVLKNFEQISSINTEGVVPLVTPSEIEFYSRVDESSKLFTAEEMVANAPERAGMLFKVPPVV